jgi:hypothetical protein
MSQKCDSCSSERLLSVTAHASDSHHLEYKDKEHLGGMLDGLGIGSGDYTYFVLCLECGKVQGEFPIPDEKVSFLEEEDDDSPENHNPDDGDPFYFSK